MRGFGANTFIKIESTSKIPKLMWIEQMKLPRRVEPLTTLSSKEITGVVAESIMNVIKVVRNFQR